MRQGSAGRPPPQPIDSLARAELSAPYGQSGKADGAGKRAPRRRVRWPSEFGSQSSAKQPRTPSMKAMWPPPRRIATLPGAAGARELEPVTRHEEQQPQPDTRSAG
jgi:hypothetical protein